MAASGSPRAGRIPFEPALEGLRGLALAGMLCFHSEFTWAVGGYLPVATFFTLSGFLITSLFLAEWETRRDIRLTRFWARRFRRLMPASLLTLAGIAAFGAFVATPEQLARLRADVLWALAYAANWRFLLSDVAYVELFTAPSPVQHFWSLAIEEQFYFAYPLVALAGLHLGSRRGLAAVLAILTLTSVGLSVALTAGGASMDRIYYGSDTRAPELLLGGLLACALHERKIGSAAVRRLLEIVGLVAMIGMVFLWATVHLESGWLYRGGFAAYSLLSVAVIAAAVQPGGWVRALLSARAIRWVGRVSYGAYLFHWPVYLWLSPERTGLDPAALFALRVGVTLGAAGLSYRLLESPIRTGRALTDWRPFVVAPAAFASVATAVVAVTWNPPRASAGFDPEVARAELERMFASRDPDEMLADDPPSRSRNVPRVAFYGDSTALQMSWGVAWWFESEGRGRTMPGVAELGCGLLRERFRFQGREGRRPRHCRDRSESWPGSIARSRPDIAVVLFGPWEVCDYQLPGDPRWLHLGDPELDAKVRAEMLEAVDVLAADGALVLWLTHPSIQVQGRGADRSPETPYPESDPARMARLNELVFELETARPRSVRVVDLAKHMRSLPAGEFDPAYRPDGTHLSAEGSLRLANEWLGAEILRVYRNEARRD